MKILAFSFFPAFVPPSNGGQSRLFNFYRTLSKQHNVILLTSTHANGDEERLQHGATFTERRIPKDGYFVREYTRLEEFNSGGDLSGPALAACGKRPTKLHQAYLEEYARADVIFHDSPFTSEYDIFAGVDKKPRVYNSYNCESQLYRQLHPAERSKPIHDLVHASEAKMLSISDLVLYCNEDDLNAFHEMTQHAEFTALYVPNGMQALAPTSLSIDIPSKKKFRAVFVGSGHLPNVDAADFIVKRLAPKLPDIQFDIAGSCLPEGQYPSNVHRHGIVPDATKRQLLIGASIALNPMAAGSGSNVKVLDYLSHRLPVLSTSFGMRGIDAKEGRDYLEAPLEQFSHALQRASESPDILSRIASSGYALALANYTWESIVGKLSPAIEKLLIAKAETFASYVLALNDYDSFSEVGGGATRTRGLYAAVSKWCPVVFVSFADDGRLSNSKYAKNITTINVPKTREHLEELNAINSRHHVSAADIVAARHSTKNIYLSAIYQVLRNNARSIVVEHCYLVNLPRAWGDRFVYSSQNHEFALKTRILAEHPLKTSLLRDVEYFEKIAVEGSAATITVSPEDAESIVQGKRSAGPVIVVRNGAAIPAQGEAVQKARDRLRHQISDRSVVFLGSAHMPNIEAGHFIVERLARQCPTVQFHLLGSVCGTITKVPSNVKLWGVVDDVTKSAVMQACALAINPMLSGSGSNVKLADCIGNGLYTIATKFGQRGYPATVQEHCSIATIAGFSTALELALSRVDLRSDMARSDRESFFLRELSMEGLAVRFVQTLKALETQKKRVLYVTYRYVAPAMGGAEVNLEKFVNALGQSGQFDVDVVTPEVSSIESYWRFSEHYSFDNSLSAPVDIPNVRFARFPLDKESERDVLARLNEVWQAQPRFERAVSQQLDSLYAESGLAWGWGYPEGSAGFASRWGFSEFGIYLHMPTNVQIEGYAPSEVTITVFSNGALLAGPFQYKGNFALELDATMGELVFETSSQPQSSDPRPLAFHATRIRLNERLLDLSEPTLWLRYLQRESADSVFRILAKASEMSRGLHSVDLSKVRGPLSSGLESFIIDHVSQYDLVIANNNVFRPAVVAIAEAKRQGIPSILIPHAHLDDDFYHFPDLLQSALNADLVLAAPKAACEFFAENGCNVRYLPAGCDTHEQFTMQDVESFRNVFNDTRPFILVLGRKAGAKGYKLIIDAVEQVNKNGLVLNVVLIGPDDDGAPITSPYATYLGRQPREVVRGALQSCLALCNMSSSESFGIVLLEAWLAGKPVIANKNCVAFHDIAIDGVNALLVTPENLIEAISSIVKAPQTVEAFSSEGMRGVDRFEWARVCEEFVDICTDMSNLKPLKI